jgi:hypothetical protein
MYLLFCVEIGTQVNQPQGHKNKLVPSQTRREETHKYDVPTHAIDSPA